LKFDNQYNIITDAQYGFKKNISTIFVLQSLINRTLKKDKCKRLLTIHFEKIDTIFGIS